MKGTDQRGTRVCKRVRGVLLCNLGLPFGFIFHDVLLRVVGGVDDMNALFSSKAKLFRVHLQSDVAKQQSGLSLAPRDESRQHFSSAVDPTAQLRCGGGPIPLIDAPTQR